MKRLLIVACVALVAASCDSGQTDAVEGVEPAQIDNVWIFQYDSLGGGDALHGGIAEIKDDCLYVDDAVVVWHRDQIDEAGELIDRIQGGEQPQVSLGGGGISLDEGDTPIPETINELCPTRTVWYTRPGP
jgi:hypothetical protein